MTLVQQLQKLKKRKVFDLHEFLLTNVDWKDYKLSKENE
jgi:hypothetical protein